MFNKPLALYPATVKQITCLVINLYFIRVCQTKMVFSCLQSFWPSRYARRDNNYLYIQSDISRVGLLNKYFKTQFIIIIKYNVTNLVNWEKRCNRSHCSALAPMKFSTCSLAKVGIMQHTRRLKLTKSVLQV